MAPPRALPQLWFQTRRGVFATLRAAKPSGLVTRLTAPATETATMPWSQLGSALPFNTETVIRHAPEGSGVYALLTQERWIYVGEAPNIRRDLLQKLGSRCVLTMWAPTMFAYQLVPDEQRSATRTALVKEVVPDVVEWLDE
jgi:hypothetical protein